MLSQPDHSLHHLVQPIDVVVPVPPKQLEISLARTKDDLLGAYELLYMAYVRAGLANENSQKLRITPFHLLPTTEVFIGKLGDTITSTMTMIFDGPDGLPMDEIYREELDGLRRSGLKIAEIGCLADRRQSFARLIKVFGEFARILAQVAFRRGVDVLVIATHPRHASFYERSFCFRQLGAVKNCPYVNSHPACALSFEFARVEGTPLHNYLFSPPFAEHKMTRLPWDEETIETIRKLAVSTSNSE